MEVDAICLWKIRSQRPVMIFTPVRTTLIKYLRYWAKQTDGTGMFDLYQVVVVLILLGIFVTWVVLMPLGVKNKKFFETNNSSNSMKSSTTFN